MCFRMTQTVHFVILLLMWCYCLLPKWLISVFFHAFFHSSFVCLFFTYLCFAWLYNSQFARLFGLKRQSFFCSLCTCRWWMWWRLQSGWQRGSWRSTVTNLSVFNDNVDRGVNVNRDERSPLLMLLHSHKINLVLVLTGLHINESLIFPFAICTTNPSAFWFVFEEPLFQFPLQLKLKKYRQNLLLMWRSYF